MPQQVALAEVGIVVVGELLKLREVHREVVVAKVGHQARVGEPVVEKLQARAAEELVVEAPSETHAAN